MKKKEKECKHSFVKYPPKIGKLKVCTKCGFLWVLGDVKFGEHTIKLSGSGNYIESSTTTTPANPASGKIRFYATSGTSLRMLNSSGTETDLAATGTLYNFLTNPGFEILQRGAGPFTASLAFAHDRWQNHLVGTDTTTITDETTIVDTTSLHSLKAVFVLGTGAGASRIFQHLANADFGAYSLRGQTVTLQIRCRTATANAIRVGIDTNGTGGTTTYSSYHSGGGTFESLNVSVAIPSDATVLNAAVYFAASCTAYLDNATLVIGSTAQTYYPLHPADEWERCQRYYEVSANWSSLRHGGGAGDAASPHGFYFTWLTRKAVQPTVTKTGTFGVTNSGQPSLGPAIGDTLGAFVSSIPTASPGFFQFYADTVDDGYTAEANP